MTEPTLLDIVDLRIALPNGVELVRGATLRVGGGESVALVGESGSGKSLTLKAVLRLLPREFRVSGRIAVEDRDVLAMTPAPLARLRSRDVAMIYQDPRLHTDPRQTIGAFLIEGVVATGVLSPPDARGRALQLLQEMGVSEPERRMEQFPHELSGGLLQRALIAMSLMSEPLLLLADEPTTALDVTVQSEVMAIIAEQVARRALGLLFVTHDLDLAAAVTDRVVVMYAGTIVEAGESEAVTTRPRHPYTAGLLQSRPSAHRVERLRPIPGRPPAAHEVPEGCPFAPRCPFATIECEAERPQLRTVGDREVACHRADDIADELRDAVHAR
jgi:peptide/nickel transport system ATP-binding protein